MFNNGGQIKYLVVKQLNDKTSPEHFRESQECQVSERWQWEDRKGKRKAMFPEEIRKQGDAACFLILGL